MNNLIPFSTNFHFFQNQDASACVVMSVNTLVDTYTKLFSHITSNSVVTQTLQVLAEPLAALYAGNAQSAVIKLFVPSFNSKVSGLLFFKISVLTLC